LKICKICKIEKPFTAFPRRVIKLKDGLACYVASICNACSYLIKKQKSDYPERKAASDKKFRDKNREELNKKQRKYIQARPKINTFYTACYRAAKYLQTPIWANLEHIKSFYINCPEGMVVDHIIPLRGKNVSGLHVEYNLQYLTISENCKKQNKIEE
jgi:5-methylcytosine-specific restriction endonuclease McrA